MVSALFLDKASASSFSEVDHLTSPQVIHGRPYCFEAQGEEHRGSDPRRSTVQPSVERTEHTLVCRRSVNDVTFELLYGKAMKGELLAWQEFTMEEHRQRSASMQNLRKRRITSPEIRKDTEPIDSERPSVHPLATSDTLESIAPISLPVGGRITEDHIKLLHLISLYTKKAITADEKDEWMRRLPLLVLIYEITIAGSFDYDYAPVSEPIGRRIMYMNISQEGRDDIDDLREEGLINGLKLSSNDYQSITAYQKGGELLRSILDTEEKLEWVKKIEETIRDPITGNLLVVHWTGDVFHIRGDSGYTRESSITTPEDVSYVSSPYLPKMLRYDNDTAMTSNSHRLSEIAGCTSTIIDQELNEVIVLSDVKVMVCEWIPFGSNHIVAMNDKLGSTERVQGGLFTALVDDQPAGTKFAMEPGLTSVQILEFDYSMFLNFEADINFPEEEGVKQIEQFGVHVRDDGSVCYGLTIDGIMDRDKDRVSLDHLSRLLADVHQDSSTILESLLTSYQRRLIETLLGEDVNNRSKFNVIIAKKITPRMSCALYMDKEEHENELKQVIGDTHASYDINDTLLITAKNGIVIVTEDETPFENIILFYMSLMGRRIILDHFFARVFSLYEMLKETRTLILNHEKSPNSFQNIRTGVSEVSKQAILLQELLGYLTESFDEIQVPQSEEGTISHKYMTTLRVEKITRDLKRRTRDLKKNIHGIQNELGAQREMSDVIKEVNMLRLQEAMYANTKNLENVIRSNERASSSLEILQLVLSGTLAFEILDRLTGEWSVLDTWWGDQYIKQPLIEKPGAWFVINLLLWFCVAYGLKHLMEALTQRSTHVLIVRVKANVPINLSCLYQYLSTKMLQEEEVGVEDKMVIKKVSWSEEDENKWNGGTPMIELSFDEKHCYLLGFFIQVDKVNKNVNEGTIKEKMWKELTDAGVVDLTDVT
ncbi:hypothetical protein PROFUN_13875 [Planoprotostelium fungivorum]|uniref:Uncharacterized protein n=1 Tax=Planoprotostelium fungivorum TaxID=1890364 RepID=A0A2P6N2U1_9EUKA|nr:hypothetical protein PROFUN_13875 [Planoprotostelium fungivorum]